MAIQVGMATIVLSSGQAPTTTIDVNVGFTPTAGQYFIFAYTSGLPDATDAARGDHIYQSIGFGASATARRCVGGYSNDGSTSDSDNFKGMYDDAMIVQINASGSRIGSLDLVGPITNGVQFIVDSSFSIGPNVQVHILVIDGLTGVGIFNILEPGTTGNTDHTGAGVNNADLFLFLNGQRSALNATNATMSFSLGAAHIDGQCVAGVGARGDFTSPTRGHYATDVECLARQANATFLANRAVFVAAITDGVTLNWQAAGSAGFYTFCAALKGIEATVQNGLTRTDTANITVTGLGNTCLGGIVLSCCSAENTAGAMANESNFSLGTFAGATQGAHAIAGKNDANPSQEMVAIDYNDCYVNLVNDAAVGRMAKTALNADGATFQMTDADPDAKWFSAILLADVGGAPPPPTATYTMGYRLF